MKTRLAVPFALAGLVLSIAAVAVAVAWEQPQANPPRRDAVDKAFQAGNFKDAYDGYRRLVLDPKTTPPLVVRDFRQAFICLQRLGRIGEYDTFADQTLTAHPDSWRVLWTVAQTDIEVDHSGFIVSGKFERGPHRGGGEFADATARDRVRALQRMVQAQGLLARSPEARGKDAGKFQLDLAGMWLNTAEGLDSWKLQELTDLDNLPDVESGGRRMPWMRWGGGQERGAPVDSEGKPVYYRRPESFETASNDGERWRWALTQAVEADPALTNTVRMQLAQFLQQQFGVQTMARYGLSGPTDDTKVTEGPFSVHTLQDNETIAQLATGVQRFTLPDEFNYLLLYRQIADDPRTGQGLEAVQAIAGEYENRRQLDKAAETWKRCVQQYGPGPDRSHQNRLDQIVKAWGRFEMTTEQPAGKPATLSYRFRNGQRVDFEAWALNVEQLLEDVKAYLRSAPVPVNWEKFQIDNLGHRIVTENQNRYIKTRVAGWGLDLKPLPKHVDSRIDVTTPLKTPGAYLVTARMANGNIARVIVWVSDTAIVKKPLAGKQLAFVADAVTGAPVPKADLDYFGFRIVHENNGRQRIETRVFRLTADDDGLAMPDVRPPDQFGQYQYLITARNAQGRFAYLGFTGVWFGAAVPEERYDQVHAFLMTDRPVYRPKQTVHFKAWVARSKYDVPEASEFVGKTFTVEITNPKGEKVLRQDLVADAFGGVEGELPLSGDATLGMYGVNVLNFGGGSFRVEEYKKPEFEVTVEAPTEPVALGEKVEATIQAKYLFGSPVTQAKVKYKVSRTPAQTRWYPARRWDWLFGSGYWWFGQDRSWYPGFSAWGCMSPMPPWWGQPSAPPEIVAEAEVPIGPDGLVKVAIDTALAKAVHGDQDHRYQITAEVTDQSRRTIVGQGDVLAARAPFQVVVWVDRGYARAGDTIEVGAAARTADGKPVAGKGTLTLLRIAYDNVNKPTETAVESWEVEADDAGMIQQKIVLAQAGQYRLALKFTDTAGHTREGGHLFSVLGGEAKADAFRYNALEVIPDRAEYRPGDKVRLMINVNKPGATVLLFVRPASGVYPAPKVIRMDGRTQVEEIEVRQGDMPNFFVEAVTVADARVHSEARQIVVPPEKRVVDVTITPETPEYLPGGQAKLKLKLTGADGQPFVGSTVMTVYDKAVEYISGGSNVPAINSVFWAWKRSHQPQTESSLGRGSPNLLRPKETPMTDIGAFGGMVVEEFAMMAADGRRGVTRMMAAPMGFAGGMGGGGMAPGAPAPMAAAMAAPAEGAMDRFKREAATTEFLHAPGLVGGGPDVVPTVRTNFADTAFWAGSITTDASGTAEVTFDLPESLTTWKIRTWSLGPGTRVGQGESQVITRKNLLVRLQAPRFFVQKDEVVLSANIHNELKAGKAVKAVLELGNSRIQALDDPERTVQIAAGGETRVDWRVKVVEEGEAVIRMKALSDEESDAVEMKFPVYVHGMLKTESYSAAIRPEETATTLAITVPEERRPEQTRLEIRYSPTLAGAIVDALPYLADYPYGCTEQTLNRFLPTVIAEKVLIDLGLDLSAIRAKRTNLNAQELGDAVERAKRWARPEHNPVWDEAEVRAMAKAGLDRLLNMQCSDGGWGWFSGFGEKSYPHTTAVVVHGLQVGKAVDLTVPDGVIERGVEWLKRYQAQQVALIQKAASQKNPIKAKADDMDAYVFMVLTDAGVKSPEMLAFLDRDRVGLSVYAKAMFGLALHKLGEVDKLTVVLQNIEQFLVQDDENQTAHLRLPENMWWYWYGSENEAHAYYLKLLARTDPKGKVAPRLVKYLINNRRNATYWNSTRDSALCVEALADYIKASGEDRPDQTVTVLVDGQEKAKVKIDASNLFAFDSTVTLGGPDLTAGAHKVEIRKEGRGPLYCNAYLTNFTMEDPITRAGLEIKVDRKVYKLIPEDKTATVAGQRGQVVTQKVEKYRREELASGALLKSGDLVEIELSLDSKNDYEYLIFEDMKAAGFEPVDVRSGYTGNALGAYVEFRDERVAFFVRNLALGQHSVSYRLRAEIPGTFSALPTKGHAMYAPELKANSDEMKLRIED